MKYKSEPNMLVKIRINGKKFIYVKFDDNGLLETTDPLVISKFGNRFEVVEEQETIQHTPQQQATTEVIQAKFKCKKCNYETDNKGLLLAHYREHNKGE